MAVIISIDGNALPPTTEAVIATDILDRGEHSVSARLVDEQGRTIASAEPVTFFVYQHSRLFNQPVPTPRGGRG